MASIKEIRTRIKSIRETMKITNAMYLIASSKLRAARGQLQNIQPYFSKTQATLHEILDSAPEVTHPYFDLRPEVSEKKRGYVVISADKGLSGSYNYNVTHFAERHMAQAKDPALFLIGNMGEQYFKSKNRFIDGEFLYMAQAPTLYNARLIAETLIKLYRHKQLDEVYVIYTEMISSVSQEPRALKLLPLERCTLTSHDVGSPHTAPQVTTFVPSATEVLDHLVPNYIKGLMYGAMAESYTSLQSARMTAMDAATNNARDMIGGLTLAYNRARQAAITQEISEIVGGAQGMNQ